MHRSRNGDKSAVLGFHLVLRGYRHFVSLHELLALLPVELLQQNNQFGLRVFALRYFLQVHGGTPLYIQLVVEVEEE